MVICKFFLQGTCRFGENCKFEHQLNNDHSYTNSSSILLQNQPAKPATNIDTNTLIKAVVNDMTSAEKGGQWLLSSYTPFKEKPAFPGFEDHSMEEIRYLFYESVKNGTIDQYKQNLQMMLQQAIMKIKALQNPTPEAINMLKNIYNTPPSNSFNNNNSHFGGGGGSTNSMFSGQQPQQNPVFGATQNNQGIFGTSANTTQQNIFAGGNSSIFGATQNTNKSIFGGGGAQNTTPLFGGQAQNNQNKMLFGQSPTPATGSSIFGANQSTSQPVFGNQQSIFGASPVPQPNIFQQSANQFGNPQTTNSGNQFGAPPNANLFRTAINQQSPFQTSQPTSPFGNQQNTNVEPPQAASPFGNQRNGNVVTSQAASPFGTPQPTQVTSPLGTPQNIFGNTQSTISKPAFQHTQNIFGNLGLQNSNNKVFGNNAPKEKTSEDFYSKLEDLTEEEIKWFQNDDLDISKIPEKPPTYEMCFRSG